MSQLRTTSLIQTLVRNSQSVSCAESLTGGLLISALVTPTGASEVVYGGVTTYATHTKFQVLGVPEDVVSEHGTVSKQTALAMARGARELFGSTWAVAITGVAGPGPHEGQQAGTVFITLVGKPESEEIIQIEKHILSGERGEVRQETAELAVELLALELDNW